MSPYAAYFTCEAGELEEQRSPDWKVANNVRGGRTSGGVPACEAGFRLRGQACQPFSTPVFPDTHLKN